MGFEEDELNQMYSLCAAIMHMGEMKFKQRGEQAEPNGDEGRSTGEQLPIKVSKIIHCIAK